MKIIDLSHWYEEDMPLFPGTPAIQIQQVSQIEEDGFRVTDFHSTVHVGTHCDAPAHFVKGAKTMGEIPLEEFVGYAVVLDVSRVFFSAAPLSIHGSDGGFTRAYAILEK